MKNILEESISIQKMIEQLFFLAKKDMTELTSDFNEIYLDEVLTDTILQIEKFALTKDTNIKIKKIIPVTIHANETLLKIAINNLLRNAIIYSPNCSQIFVSLDENGVDYLLSIEDNGYGINEEDLAFVFERFYRADKARSLKDGGTGLGLAIVKMILDIHGYKIELFSKKGSGTTVQIKIPKIMALT